MKFEAALERWHKRALSQAEVAETLGMSERTFRRWRGRHEEAGLESLYDGGTGRASARRVAVERVNAMLELYWRRYRGFTVEHFHEHLAGAARLPPRLHLHQAGVARGGAGEEGAAARRAPQDTAAPAAARHDADQCGSTHRWIPRPEAELDPTVALDDEEGTCSSFQSLAGVIETHGLFCSLYTDRASHYFHTPEAGGKVGRALAQLGIEHIAAYSPAARGRSERMFATLQDRLPKELALAGIANRFIAEHYLPRHNARFAVTPAEPGPPLCQTPAGRRATSYASSTSASSATTTPCATTASLCISRPVRSAPTTCGPRCACTAIATARLPSFMGRAASPATAPTPGQIEATRQRAA